MDSTNWLSLLQDSIPLSLINIPGTHDSSTQFVTLSPFSRCQNKSIGQQLEIGIRFLDIRLELKGADFNAVHGIADCRTLKSRNSPLLHFDDTFERCLNFLQKHPTEAIILSLKMERGNNSDEFFSTFTKRFIVPYFSNWFLENRIPSLNECRGKLVLMRRCVLGKPNKAFTDQNSGMNFTNMVQKDASENSLQLLCSFKLPDEDRANDSAVIQDQFMLHPKAKWERAAKICLESAEPNDETVYIHYLSTAGMPFLPSFNSKYVNSKFNKFELKSKKAYGWIILDFPTEALTAKIIESNF